MSGVFGDRHIESNINIKILHINMNNLYGFAMLQYLPTGIFHIFENTSTPQSFVNKVIKTHDCSNIDNVLIAYLIYPDKIKPKSENFSFCPENKIIDPVYFTEYMKEHVPKPYRPTNKLICDQTNKKYYILDYRNLKFYVRMGMIISKVHRIVSFDKTPCLEKHLDYNTKKEHKLTQILKKMEYKYTIKILMLML